MIELVYGYQVGRATIDACQVDSRCRSLGRDYQSLRDVGLNLAGKAKYTTQKNQSQEELRHLTCFDLSLGAK